MILRSNPIEERRKVDFHLPADVFPILAGASKFDRLWALPAIGLSYTNRLYSSIHEGEDQITWGDFAHGFVEWIPCTVGVALRRPEIAALHFVAVGLILIDPPVAHTPAA